MTSTDRAQSVVAFGGGHGLHASLTALRLLLDDLTVDQLTAIVTVADNGGSSGRLRDQFDVLPPGDLRMALAALCGDDQWGDTWARVLQHRFAGDGDMRGHVIGNLLIVGLWELLGDHVDALDWVGRLLGAKGRVLPMALAPMDIRAEVRGAGDDPDALTTVRGQVEVATTDGVITEIALDPPDPPVEPGRARRDRRGRLGRARPRLVVLLGDPAPAGAGDPRGARRHRRAPGRRPQPRGRRRRRDRWLRPGRPPLGAARARPRPPRAPRARRPARPRRRPASTSCARWSRPAAPSSSWTTSWPTTAPRVTTRTSSPRPTRGSSNGPDWSRR